MFSIISLAYLSACGTSQPAPVSQAGLGSASVQVAPLGDFDALLAGIEFGDVNPYEVRVVWESDGVSEEIDDGAAQLELDEGRFEDDESRGQRSIRRMVQAIVPVPAVGANMRAPELELEEEVALLAPVEAMSVDRVIRRYSTQTQYCHETAKERYSQVAGRIELAWVIEEGEVSRVEVLDNTTGDQAMADCVARKVQRWRFPAETTEEVRHPFVFQRAL